MRLTKQEILELDSHEFTEADKKYLIDKFFPKTPTPAWQMQLQRGWEGAKRWERYDEHWSDGQIGHEYRHTQDKLLRFARLREGRKQGHNRVTDFTSWIYRLYMPPPSRVSLANGKRVEREVSLAFGGVPEKSGWELIFQDPLDGASRAPLQISGLIVDGLPLWGMPDLVFRERATGRILVLERKASNAELPSNGWPNLRAQLWAYGQIDEWKNAPEIILIGEVWGFGYGPPRVRHVYRWSISDKEFFHDNQSLFDIYASKHVTEL